MYAVKTLYRYHAERGKKFDMVQHFEPRFVSAVEHEGLFGNYASLGGYTLMSIKQRCCAHSH